MCRTRVDRLLLPLSKVSKSIIIVSASEFLEYLTLTSRRRIRGKASVFLECKDPYRPISQLGQQSSTFTVTNDVIPLRSVWV